MSEWQREDHAFLETKPYKRFEEFCNACIEYKYIGICYGSPGVGKTQSAKYFSKYRMITEAKPNGYLYEDNKHISSDLHDCATLFHVPLLPVLSSRLLNNIQKEISHMDKVVGAAKIAKLMQENSHFSTKEQKNNFVRALKLPKPDFCKLIIVDETERLSFNALELLRSLYDRKKIALIFIGMPGLERRLSRYPQLYSRIGFSHEFTRLSKDEMLFTLEHHWQKLGLQFNLREYGSHEAITTIIRTTNGNFRLINRLFAQIERILKLNKLQYISNEVVVAAKDCLLIGND